MKIIRLKLNLLRNEEWFNFFTEFKTLVTQATPGALNIDDLFAAFLTLYTQADDALEILRKSSLTEEIVHLDGLRDGTFRGIADNVRSSLHHFDPARREAAHRIIPIFDHYGDLARKPFNEETAGIVNFLQEVRNKYAPQVQILGINEWLNELERNNNDFETAVLERNAEIAARPDVNMLDVRRKTGLCYHQIVERLEALILLNGETAYGDFVTKLNVNIERYKNVLSRRGEHKPKEN
jgi:hypothetical protein